MWRLKIPLYSFYLNIRFSKPKLSGKKWYEMGENGFFIPYHYINLQYYGFFYI